MDEVFQETAEAAKLLNDFYSLMQKEKTPSSTAVFFDKDYLTIAEFLAPIGGILTARPVEQPNSTIQSFITSSLKHKQGPANRTKRKTLTELLSDSNSETIQEFLDRI